MSNSILSAGLSHVSVPTNVSSGQKGPIFRQKSATAIAKALIGNLRTLVKIVATPRQVTLGEVKIGERFHELLSGAKTSVNNAGQKINSVFSSASRKNDPYMDALKRFDEALCKTLRNSGPKEDLGEIRLKVALLLNGTKNPGEVMEEISKKMADIEASGDKMILTKDLYQKFYFACGFVFNFPKVEELERGKAEEALRLSAKTVEKRESVKSETPKIHNKPVVPQSKVRGGGWDSVLKQMESSPLFQKQKAQREKEGSEVPNDVTATKRESIDAMPKAQEKVLPRANKGISTGKVSGALYMDELKQKLAERGKIE